MSVVRRVALRGKTAPLGQRFPSARTKWDKYVYFESESGIKAWIQEDALKPIE